MSKDPREGLRHWLATGHPPRPAPERAGDLVSAAREQGVVGLLHAAVRGEGSVFGSRERSPTQAASPRGDYSVWPASVLVGLRDAHRALLARGVQQLDLAARAQRLLLRRGLRALPLKGAAVAERLYDSVADRPMSDVDLLCLDDWAASVAALIEDGFVEMGRADHAWSFRDPVSGGVLELHHAVTSCAALFPLDHEGLWARSLPGGAQVPRIPATEDVLVHLSLHAAFQHGLILSLVQYMDFRRLLERDPPRPDLLLELAAQARAEAAVAASLEVAALVVSAPVDSALRDLFAGALHGALGALLEDRHASPLRFVTPARPELASVRWHLARGRRVELLRRTLAPAPPAAVARWRRVWDAAVRLACLLRRWVIPSFRAWISSPGLRAG